MASDLQRWLPGHRAWTVAVAAAALIGLSAARADDSAANLKPQCPRLASPAGQSYLQPMRILPDQVSAKNQLGCLSPADAVYGPDGCPLRFCGGSAGAFPLPAGSSQLGR